MKEVSTIRDVESLEGKKQDFLKWLRFVKNPWEDWSGSNYVTQLLEEEEKEEEEFQSIKTHQKT